MSHYYDRNTGQLLPMRELKVRPGEYVEATLADARKVGALVSVTTVIDMLSKPGLTKWQVEQGITAARTWPELPVEDLFIKSREYTQYTQDFGHATHWWVNTKLREFPSTELPPIVPGSEEVADRFVVWARANGFEWQRTEHRFLRPDLGYAGTVDLLGTYRGTPCIADLKTQSQPLTFHDPDYPVQLAGYAQGCALPPGTLRISLVADREEPGVVSMKQWAEPERYDRIFNGLLETWMLVHKYDPREV